MDVATRYSHNTINEFNAVEQISSYLPTQFAFPFLSPPVHPVMMNNKILRINQNIEIAQINFWTGKILFIVFHFTMINQVV